MNKQCPSCQKEIAADVDVCPHCNWRFIRNTSLQQGTRRTKHSKTIIPRIVPQRIMNPGALELAIEIDRTGSSQQFQHGIYSACEIIFKQLKATISNITCWVQTHGDLDYGEKPMLLTEAGTTDQVLNAIRAIKYSGGGDAPEHHLDGIERLLNIVPWSANILKARAAMICFLTDETKLARSGITAEQLGAEIKKLGILFYAVCEPKPIVTNLVKNASGLMFKISNNPDPDELRQIAVQLGASITATIGRGDTVAMLN